MTASDRAAPPGTVAAARIGVLSALASFALMSMTDAAGKLLTMRYPPLLLAFFFVGFAMLAVLAGGLWRDLRRLRPRHPWLMAGRALGSTVSGLGGLFAFAHLPLAEVYTILFTTPLLVASLSGLLLRERVGRRRWAAVCVGLAGVVVALRPGFEDLSFGHLAALAAAVSLASSSIIMRRIGPYEDRATLTLMPMLGTLLLTGAALPFTYQPLPLSALLACAAIGAAIAVAQFCLVNAYRLSPASAVAPFQYSQMVWAIVLGLALFGDRPDPLVLAGGALIIGSGLVLLLFPSEVSS